MSAFEEPTVTSAIQRFDGTPNKRGRRGENKRWSRFKDWLSGWFKTGTELSSDFIAAKVNEAQAETEIKREKAAEIAARTDLLKNKAVEKFCDIIDDKFREIDPELAENLKLAKLLDSNPAIAEQIERVNELRHRLATEKGTRIDIFNDQPKRLTAKPEDFDEGIS